VVDLYFYFGANADFDIPGSSPAEFTGSGIFTSGNTRVLKNVPVVDGKITGIFGKGPTVVGVLNGLTLKQPFPRPFVRSTSPAGKGVIDSSAIAIELLDYVTQVDPGSIQLYLNGQAVTPIVARPVGTNLTSITYDPPGALPESTNTVRVIFGDNSSPARLQTNEFSFEVIGALKAASIANIDFNGARNVPGPMRLTNLCRSERGRRGQCLNGILADSRLEDGTDEDNLTVGGTNLLNSLGGATTIGFTCFPSRWRCRRCSDD
jgi:hypothetical protein